MAADSIYIRFDNIYVDRKSVDEIQFSACKFKLDGSCSYYDGTFSAKTEFGCLPNTYALPLQDRTIETGTGSGDNGPTYFSREEVMYGTAFFR